MNLPAYSSSLVLNLFLLFQLPSSASSNVQLRPQLSTLKFTNSSSNLSLVLPLKMHKVVTSSSLMSAILPNRPTNKLLFHHNITLTVPIAVGTPARNLTLVLDTGSDLSTLLCTNISNSSTPPFLFDPRNSSSYHPIPCNSTTCTSLSRDLSMPPLCDEKDLCHVSLSYADGSSGDGTLSIDSFAVGNSTPLTTAFGCMSSSYSSASGDPGVAGLLGMNRGAFSFVSQASVPRFAYCISDIDSSGVLVIGDAADADTPPLNYTPMIEISLPLPYFDRVAYSVQLEGIRVGNTLLPIPKYVLVPDHTGAGQTMVDSGTQFTFILGPAYDALKTEFVRQTRGVLKVLDEPDFVFEGALDLCFKIPVWRDSPPIGLPTVALVLRGAEVEVKGERLLYRAAGERRGSDAVWCLTFGNSDLVPLSAYVIGHHHQHNVWVEYDLQNGRVGFAPIRCDLAGRRLGMTL